MSDSTLLDLAPHAAARPVALCRGVAALATRVLACYPWGSDSPVTAAATRVLHTVRRYLGCVRPDAADVLLLSGGH